jgi:hypothetical protein
LRSGNGLQPASRPRLGRGLLVLEPALVAGHALVAGDALLADLLALEAARVFISAHLVAFAVFGRQIDVEVAVARSLPQHLIAAGLVATLAYVQVPLDRSAGASRRFGFGHAVWSCKITTSGPSG